MIDIDQSIIEKRKALNLDSLSRADLFNKASSFLSNINDIGRVRLKFS